MDKKTFVVKKVWHSVENKVNKLNVQLQSNKDSLHLLSISVFHHEEIEGIELELKKVLDKIKLMKMGKC